MKASTLVLLVTAGLVAVLAAAEDSNAQRIAGGAFTTINQYPYAVSLLYSSNLANYFQACGATIISGTAMLTAAYCTYGDAANRWRARVGSTYANSGGIVHNFRLIANHPSFNRWTYDNDIAVLRTSSYMSNSNVVRPASIAGNNYILNDNQPVWAIGWGRTSSGGAVYEQLRHVQIWTVNQNVCRQRYAELGRTITDNMLCAGWLDVGGRDQCQGDNGGPLIHNGVIVGVCSYRDYCGQARYPGINTRVSRYMTWIQQLTA